MPSSTNQSPSHEDMKVPVSGGECVKEANRAITIIDTIILFLSGGGGGHARNSSCLARTVHNPSTSASCTPVDNIRRLLRQNQTTLLLLKTASVIVYLSSHVDTN